MMEKQMGSIFPLQLPSSADLEEAAQAMEEKAMAALGCEEGDPDIAAVYFMAAASYRQVFEERQTREALRAVLQKVTSKSLAARLCGAR